MNIYLDGSALRNPGHEGGIAAILQYDDEREPVVIFKESYKETTNNRMELRAAIHAIEYLRKIAKKERVYGTTIWSDSQYLCDNLVRARYWRNAGWVNAEGRPIENKDLWKRLLSLLNWSPFSISIRWNEGKTTPVLKQVDKLAKGAAKGVIRKTDYGYRVSRVARSKAESNEAPSLFPASGQEEVIRIYAHVLMKTKPDIEYKIKFDLYSPEDRRFMSKHVAYIRSEKLRVFHRNHCYKATFNSNPNYPVIEHISDPISCP